MVEYKKLHNKLNWKLKSAQTDEDHTNAEQALKRSKTHREEMLQNFMKVQSLSWIGTLHSRNEKNGVTSGSEAETEDLGPSGMPASFITQPWNTSQATKKTSCKMSLLDGGPQSRIDTTFFSEPESFS